MILHFRQMKFDNLINQQEKKPMDALAIVNLISAIAPSVTALIQDAEGIFGSGTGAQKQQFVTGAVASALQGSVAGATAAGATDVTKMIGAIVPSLGNIVNLFVAVGNAFGSLGTSSKSPAA
jgi:hypothetical protein